MNGVTTFFATLESKIEVIVQGTMVYQLMGMKMDSGKWDWLMCQIEFDGTAIANSNTRYWQVTDRNGSDMPWEVRPWNIPQDTRENWKYLGDGDLNYTSCPEGSSKCIFTCSSSRNHDT